MFTPGDLGDLTEQLRRLLTDDVLRRRLGRQAREDMEQHGWLAATEALVDYYRKAIRVQDRFDPESDDRGLS